MIIMLAGRKRSGKNTTADFLKERFERDGKTVEYFAFAERIKKICKEECKPLWDILNEEIPNFIDNNIHWEENKTKFTRRFMEILGTDIFRKHVNGDYWVEIVEDEMLSSTADIKIITDLRFNSEYTFFNNGDYKSITIKVVRDGVEKTSTASEVEVDGMKCNYLIVNNGSLEELKENVDVIYSVITDD